MITGVDVVAEPPKKKIVSVSPSGPLGLKLTESKYVVVACLLKQMIGG